MNLENFAELFIWNMPDALVVSDDEGVIRLWNVSAERIFGFTAEEAMGQPLDIIVPERLRRRHGDGYRETMLTGETKYGAGDLLSVPALRKDGTTISIQFSILPLSGPDGRMTGVAAVIRDVSDEFARVKKLQTALRESGGAARDG
ncbi:PAS domain S-box protein [uncultured Sneathiella sp.]|uniref:PAS domain-containing protein n=1 Tax=uncultured Sneathiella sp. TaxID=879315 RepID=UPI0030EE7750|tara:strand:+ start:17978 stop:18415 length:438 start_codon:yes stop_codon:yes gene_type:complete